MSDKSVVDLLVSEKDKMKNYIIYNHQNTIENKPQCQNVQKPQVDPPVHHSPQYSPPVIDETECHNPHCHEQENIEEVTVEKPETIEQPTTETSDIQEEENLTNNNLLFI